jgi:hypothetical protein
MPLLSQVLDGLPGTLIGTDVNRCGWLVGEEGNQLLCGYPSLVAYGLILVTQMGIEEVAGLFVSMSNNEASHTSRFHRQVAKYQLRDDAVRPSPCWDGTRQSLAGLGRAFAQRPFSLLWEIERNALRRQLRALDILQALVPEVGVV